MSSSHLVWISAFHSLGRALADVRWLRPDAGIEAQDASSLRWIEERLDEHRALFESATGHAPPVEYELERSAARAAERWESSWQGHDATGPWLSAVNALGARCFPANGARLPDAFPGEFDRLRRGIRARSTAWKGALRDAELGTVAGENLLRAHLAWLCTQGPGAAERSPFWPLLALCERGLWPVMLREGRWLLYLPQLDAHGALVPRPEAPGDRTLPARAIVLAQDEGARECGLWGFAPPGIDHPANSTKRPRGYAVVYEHRHQRAALDMHVVKIGRDRKSHLRLDDGRVSRMHTVLECSGTYCNVIDLGSGTLADGAPVNKCDLRDGMKLELAGVPVRITLERAEG